MSFYKVKNGIEFVAATPETADASFIHRASDLGFEIAQTTFPDEKPRACFINSKTNQVIIGNDYLVIISGSDIYFAVPADAFRAIFELTTLTSIPTPPAQPDAPVVQSLKGKSFFIDPGHGGSDPGAINDNLGLQEKIAALEIALLLGKQLEAQGAAVYYSRTDNGTRPGLTQRANTANSLNVTAFISVHLNSAENKAASGIETLVYGNTGKAYELAEEVQANMVAATGFKNRGVKLRPDLTVLAKTKMPAILCEVGFVSNDDEARQLFTNPVQAKLASAIAKGVVEEFGG